MPMQTIQDHHIRQAALNPVESFIVQAPAGSGKTELLTQRYLVLLAKAHKAPEEVVAITFTRKAAAEMRSRILSALLFAKEDAPDQSDYRFTTWDLANQVNKKDVQLNWQLTKNPNRLRILTIDALATFLCRQTPMRTQLGMQPNICQQPEALYQQAARQLIMHVSQDSHWQPALTQLLLHLDNQVSKLEALFSSLLAHRDQWLPHIMLGYQQNDDLLRESLEESLKRIALEKMRAASNQIPNDLKQQLTILIQHAGNYFKAEDAAHPISACSDWVGHAEPTLEAFDAWKGFANLLLTKTGEWRKTVTVRMGFATEDPYKPEMSMILSVLQVNEALKNTLADILICPPVDYSDSQWATLTTLTQLLPLLVAQLSVIFQEKGQIDFVELNLAALKALGNEEEPTDLALYLDYQIRHLLIDEFQDTSVVHMSMIEQITAGWEVNDGRTLFLVGDPMQSIYRFRNAEVGLFLRTQTQGIGHLPLTPLILTMNFRSQAGLVDWFNTAFDVIFPTTSDIATGRVPYTPAIAALNKAVHQSVYVKLLCDETDAIEASQIVEAIVALKQQKPDESIAILTRTRSQLTAIIEALHLADVAFQAIDIEPLATRAEIKDLLSLTRALLHRADRIAWLSILRAPICGCTLADLHAVATFNEKHTIWEALLQAESIEALSTDGLARIKRLRQCFIDAYCVQNNQHLSQWIQGVWMQLGGPATINNEHMLKQVARYFSLIDVVEKETQTFQIALFIEALNNLYAQPNSELSTNVHIMTIHKSKGLEFDHVFLLGLQKQTMPDREKLFRWLERPNELGTNDLLLAPIKSTRADTDAIYHYLKVVEQEKLSHEMTRLFYVAATRAKKSLHLYAHIQQNAKKPNEAKLPKKGSFLEKLWPIVQPMANACVLEKQQFSQAVILNEANNLPEKSVRLISDWSHPLLVGTDKPQKSDASIVHIPVEIRSPTASITGTMIHNILQRIADGKMILSLTTESWPWKQWQSELLSLGLLPGALSESLSNIKQAILGTLSDARGQWILSNDHLESQSEWALSYRNSKQVTHYIVDRTFVDKSNHTRWIIDYKTSLPKDADSVDDFFKKQKVLYQAQLGNYAMVISQMENYPIKLGLYFPLCQGWVEWDYSPENN